MTRVAKLVDSARECVPHAHLCWAFEDRAEFLARAAEYTAGALAAGQWVEYVGEGRADQLRAELAGVGGLRDAVDAGRVGVVPIGDFYVFSGRGGVVDPERSVAARVAATERALAAGYTGYRGVIDATAVARTEEQRAAFARFEYLIDRQMSRLPVSALCGYDVGALGDAVAELACLHPLASTGSTSFHLYAAPGVDFALTGYIDMDLRQVFATTLARVAVPDGCAGLVVDGRGLEFVDHHALRTLTGHAGASGVTVTLRTRGSSIVNRLVELLDCPELRVETAS